MNNNNGRTISKEKFISLMSEMGESVYEFHDRFHFDEVRLGGPYSINTSKQIDDMKRKVFLQLEELGEFSRALNNSDWDNMREEIVDNLYVAMGTALVMGRLLEEDLSHVLHKNNNKTPENYIARYYERK